MDILLFSDDRLAIVAKPSRDTVRPRLRFSLAKYRESSTATLIESNGFKPIRILGNIAIEDADHPGNYPKELGQPVQFKFFFTQDDLNAAGNEPLALAFWENNGWVKFATPNLKIQPTAKAAGFASVTLSQTPWTGDPPTSWGK